MLVYWMTDMALAILLGSSLGYLGLGAQPPDGRMGRADRRRQELHDARPGGSRVFPGFAIVLCGLGFSLPATASPTCCDVKR